MTGMRIAPRLCSIAAAVLLGSCDFTGSVPGTHVDYLADYVAIVRGEVDVVGGLVRVFAPQSGRIEQIRFRLGDRVQAGAVLATLDARASQAAVSLATAEAAMAQARRGTVQVGRLAAAALLARLELARKAEVASDQTVEDARAEVARQAALESEAVAAVDAATVRLRTARQALDETRIRAPVGGEIVQVRAAPLMHVAFDGDAPLFVLVPARARVVRAQISEEFAGLVHSGMQASVAMSGPRERVFTAQAVRVSSYLRHRDMTQEDGEPMDARVLDCEIDIDAPELRVGQPVLVRFSRDRP